MSDLDADGESAFGPAIDSKGTNFQRWFFALPDPLPFPDGYQVTERVSDEPDSSADGEPAVTIIFRQVESEYGRIRGSTHAVLDVIGRTPGIAPLPLMDEFEEESAVLTSHYTVIEAATIGKASGDSAEAPTGLGADLSPRVDPFNRCLRLAYDLARAYRVAARMPYGLPAYERISQPVICYSAPAVREIIDQADSEGNTQSIERIRTTGPWSGPQVLLLDHLNTADVVKGPVAEGKLHEDVAHWMRSLRAGFPFFSWRERTIEADRALHMHGEYAQAVTLTETACEVLLDSALMLLFWEEGVDPATAAEIFEEGRLARRIKTQWQSRLGGNWNLEGSGEVAQWFQSTARLRNRVVHGGYYPKREEAEKAYQAAFPLQGFVFDRLVEKRNKYSRETLITVGQAGLERRGRWNGSIKRFADENAGQQSYWISDFRTYRDAVTQAIFP